MWATAAAAERSQSSPVSSMPAPAADIATVAVVPSTNARREISGGSDMISSQRLTHTMHRAAAIADHRHIGIVNVEAFGAARGHEILAGGGHQHALLPQGHHIGAHLHGIAIGNGDDADSLRAQPLHEFGLHRFDAN